MPQFVIYGGSGEKTWNFPDAEVFIIGRARSCALHLADQTRRVSQQHAAVVRVSATPGCEYFIRDLGSREGTTVDGQHVYQRLISDGNIVQIADYRLVFHTTDGYRRPSPRIRVISSDDSDEIGAETITSLELRKGLYVDSVGQELLEQFTRDKDLGGTARSLVREFTTRLLRHVGADRGFVGQIVSPEIGEYEALEIFGLRADEDFGITAGDWLKRVLAEETIEESARTRNTLVVPIKTRDGVEGFFCVERAAAPFSQDSVAFLQAIGDVVGAAWATPAPNLATDPQDDLRVWPVEMIGCSGQMDKLRNEIHVAATAKQNTLIFGETGTGKEVVATALYHRGCAPSAPKIDIACGALPESLAESELFGKERGAYTGADRTTKGVFERAHGGALLLDDIQHLPSTVRQKLYRVLLDKRVSRVGSSQSSEVDVFIIGTVEVRPDGSHDFQTAFLERFPQKIYVPPLHKRREDIPLLAFCFLDSCAAKECKRTRSISHRALEILTTYEWPGNVRELKTCIENAVRQDVEVILSSDLPTYVTNSESAAAPGRAGGAAEPSERFVPRPLTEVVKDTIEKTLMANAGNKAATARILGLSEQGLRNKMRALGIGPTYGKADK